MEDGVQQEKAEKRSSQRKVIIMSFGNRRSPYDQPANRITPYYSPLNDKSRSKTNRGLQRRHTSSPQSCRYFLTFSGRTVLLLVTLKELLRLCQHFCLLFVRGCPTRTPQEKRRLAAYNIL